MKEDTTYRDRELFKRIAQGDTQAFTTFFKAYSVDLAGYVARFLRSELWAEEIIQDVFLKLWASREMLDQVDVPGAFIYRMILNRAKDHLKHREHEVRLQHYLSGLTTDAGANDTQDAVDFRIGKKLFDEAVRQLPRQRALVFKMRHEQGLSYDQIAQHLQVSPHTVRNLLNLAMQHIRSYLLEHGGITGLMIVSFLFSS